MKGPEGERWPDGPDGCAVHIPKHTTGHAQEVFKALRLDDVHHAAAVSTPPRPQTLALRSWRRDFVRSPLAKVAARLGS